MAYQLDFQTEHRRLILTVDQRLDFFGFRIAWLEFLTRHPDVRLQSTLWDLTRLDTGEILESDLRQMAKTMMGMGRAMDIALVVPDKALAGLPLSYLGVLMEEVESFRMFRTIEAGNRWLDQRTIELQDEAES